MLLLKHGPLGRSLAVCHRPIGRKRLHLRTSRSPSCSHLSALPCADGSGFVVGYVSCSGSAARAHRDVSGRTKRRSAGAPACVSRPLVCRPPRRLRRARLRRQSPRLQGAHALATFCSLACRWPRVPPLSLESAPHHCPEELFAGVLGNGHARSEMSENDKEIQIAELQRKLAEVERRAAEEAAARAASERRAEEAERRAAAAEAAVSGVEADSSEAATLEAVTQRFKSLKLGSPSKAKGDSRVFRRGLSALLNEPPLTLGSSVPPETLAEVFKVAHFEDGEPLEATWYPLATHSVPECVNAERRTPGAKLNAEAVYGEREEFDLPEHIVLPLKSEPEFFVTVKKEGDPGYAGEQKRFEQGTLNEWLTYVFLGILHSAFRVGSCARGRRFHTNPPVGFGLLACSQVGFLLGVEWVGKLMVYHVSQPFFLGSPEHAKAVSALPLTSLSMQDAVVVPHTGGKWCAYPAVGEPSVTWTAQASSGGRFWKIISCTAFDSLQEGGVARLRALHEAYKRYSVAFDAAPPHDPPPPTLVKARLLYGAFELLVDMHFVGDRHASPEELASAHIADDVAAAVAWLARRGLLYVDLRPQNVRVRELQGPPAKITACWLVDYDDVVLLKSPAQQAADVVRELRLHKFGVRALNAIPALEAALLRTPWPAEA